MAKYKTYSEKLRDPRWQQKRLEVYQRDNWMCTRCKRPGQYLNVHHLKYTKGCDPWEYEMKHLTTLCDTCHRIEHQQIAPSQTEWKQQSSAIYEESKSFLTATQTHIDILMNTLSKGVPSEVEDEILKNIVYLQNQRKEYLNG